jgi:hypothetical protein
MWQSTRNVYGGIEEGDILEGAPEECLDRFGLEFVWSLFEEESFELEG